MGGHLSPWSEREPGNPRQTGLETHQVELLTDPMGMYFL